MFEITLSKPELDYLMKLAHKRNDPKKGIVKNKKVDRRFSDVETNFQGLMGEAAVAKLLNVPIDDNISLKGDGGITDLLWKSYTIQVKYNNYSYGDLYFFNVNEFKADIAFLVLPLNNAESGGRVVNVRGYMTREEFKKTYEEVDWGYGLRHRVPQHLLHDVRDLFNPAPKVKEFPQKEPRHICVDEEADVFCRNFFCAWHEEWTIKGEPLPDPCPYWHRHA